MVSARDTILYVEDDPLVCDVVCELLQAGGYTVDAVVDANEALLRLADADYALVLLDVMLPGLDGRELCRRIRSHEGEVYVPIIMLTALTAEADRHAAFAAGADDYVTKPFDTADLLDRVAAWLHARERLQQAHDRLVAEQRRLRALEQQALRERLAQDEAVLAMARTASHELNQPLTVLLGLLELWQTGYIAMAMRDFVGSYRPRPTTWPSESTSSATSSATTTMIAGYRLVDLTRARDQAAAVGC